MTKPTPSEILGMTMAEEITHRDPEVTALANEIQAVFRGREVRASLVLTALAAAYSHGCDVMWNIMSSNVPELEVDTKPCPWCAGHRARDMLMLRDAAQREADAQPHKH